MRSDKRNAKIVGSFCLLLIGMLCAGCEGTEDRYGSEAQTLSEMLDFQEPIEPVNTEAEYNSKENAARPYDVTFEGDTYIRLNNNQIFDEVFGRDNLTLDELYDVIDKNKSITKEYNAFFKQYFKELTEYYPGLELRVFAYNLKDVKMEFMDEYDIHDKIGPSGSAMYDYDNNIIILQKDLDYQNNMWDLICLRHEIAHMRNHFKLEKGDYTYSYRFWIFWGAEGSVGAMTDEALTVLFSTEPYLSDYKEAGQLNMGYPLLSNELRVILDAIDYSPMDSVSHNLYYLEDRMNDVMGDDEAHDIIKIIDRQQSENVDQKILQDDPEYNQLYTYITKLYLKKYVKEGMDYNGIMDLEEALKRELLIAVHNPEYVYTSVIDDVCMQYCAENGIEK